MRLYPAIRALTAAWLRIDERWRLLAIATCAALIVGWSGIGEPLEKQLLIQRNWVRQHDASGDIVLVGIDDESLNKVGQWPWPRRYHAKMIDTLLAKGAKRVFVDITFNAASNPIDDSALARSLRRANGQATIAVNAGFVPESTQLTTKFPEPIFSRDAPVANIGWMRDEGGEVWRVPFGVETEGRYFPSMAPLLAGRKGTATSYFPIDFAVKAASIPRVRAMDVLSGRVTVDRIAGHNVLIAGASRQLGDTLPVPGQTLAYGAMLHVLAAETLLQGTPRELSFLWMLPIMLACGIAYLFGTEKLRPEIVTAILVGFAFTPVLFESMLLFLPVTPALFGMSVVAIGRVWKRTREHGATINISSGLPNLNALRIEHGSTPAAASVVAMRLRNYSEIASALPPGDERVLISEIQRRLELGIGGSRLYQGDEGVFVWLSNASTAALLEDTIEGLHAVLSGPVKVSGRQVDLTVSFGVDHNADRDLTNRIGSALLACDEAADENHKWKSYDAARLEDAEWRLSLLGRLDTAIDKREIWVAYQPQLDLRSARVVGAEALARWLHPDKGLIPPDDFIQAAEQHNRIEKLTLYVLDEAIKAAASINRRGIPFGVAVNLSARVLESPFLCEMIEELLVGNGLPANLLTLEVTETAAIVGSAQAAAMLQTLRDWEIGVSIDDYGTGFSTLEYLRAIPATEIKIDKSFISQIEHSQADRLMVASTIQLAHSLGRTVVAEGVESTTTLTLLRDLGCDTAQGFHIGRPMKLVGLSRLLIEERNAVAA